MRKFWVILLSVGLIVALAAPVFAVDVKFSGSYVVQGYYEDNRQISDLPGSTVPGTQPGPSLSLTWQRLRMGTVFQVAEGLSLTTRFDAMERVWGAVRQPTGMPYQAINDANGIQETGSGEAENIVFQHVYATFNTGIGRFLVGYQAQTGWGTSFGDSTDYAYGPRARWDMTAGPWFFGLIWDKYEGGNATYPDIGYTTPGSAPLDASNDKYSAFFVYNWSKGNGGLLVQFIDKDADRYPSGSFSRSTKGYLIDPYVKATMGPVYFEAEFIYLGGKIASFDSPARQDIGLNGYSAYAMAKVDFKPAYAGAAFVYVSGDDAGDTTTYKGGIPGGADFNPCLILGNYDLNRWAGFMGNATIAALNTSQTFLSNPFGNPLGPVSGVGLQNVWAAQAFVGVTPVPKLDAKLSLTWARLDKTPSDDAILAKVLSFPRDSSDGNWISKDLGWEADITATYKIYDNLSWMVGFGYLWAGDAFKGVTTNADVKNDYLLTHKLTLSF